MTPLPMMSKSDARADANLLSRTHVAKPCPADWAQMTGDDQSRFCGSCKKNVYNLSAMTATEAAALIREKEGKLCVRYYHRADGTIMTQDCPVGVAAFQRKVRRAFAASVVGAASFLLMVSEGMRFATDKPSLFAERMQVWAQRIHPKQEPAVIPAVNEVTEVHAVGVMGGVVAIRPDPSPLPESVTMGDMAPTPKVTDKAIAKATVVIMQGAPRIAPVEVRGQAVLKQK